MHTLPHLTPERLAALTDDPPSPMERAHLDSCAHCHAEQDAHVRLAAMASAERARIGAPAASWDVLAPGLRAEGLIKDVAHGAPLTLVRDSSATPQRQPRATHVTFTVPRWAMQAAAALLLVAGGVVVGRLTGEPRPTVATAAATPAPGVRTVADTDDLFRSRDEAMGAMQAAEKEYQRAAEYLARTDSVAAPAAEASAADVYRARLAAFDGVVAATQQALYAAPADPVINRYYLATNAAREMALRQLSLVAPAGGQINRY